MRAEHVAVMAQVGTGGLNQWIMGNIIPALFFFLGCVMLWKGKGGDNAGVFKILGPVIMALTVLGVAVTNQWESVARFMASLFTTGGHG